MPNVLQENGVRILKGILDSFNTKDMIYIHLICVLFSRRRFIAMADYEPNAVANKTFESWMEESMESCILNDNDRQCNFKDGDIIDHPLVSEF